jgi:steroid delta-isomerase-like uncharacterized protein
MATGTYHICLQIIGRKAVTRITVTCCLLLATLVAGCRPSTQGQLEANKNRVRQVAAKVEAKEWDERDALVAEDMRRHSRATSQFPEIRSREEFKRLEQMAHEAFPDRHVTYEIMIAEGDMVAVYATFTGTNTGSFGGLPPTNKLVEVKYLAIFRIEDGKMAEVWVEWDNLSRLAQLGLSPSPSVSGDGN